MVVELHNILVGCTGKPQDYEWMKNLLLNKGDVAVAECATSLITLAVDCGRLASIADDIEIVSIIMSFIKAVNGIAESCPTAIQYIDQNGL
mmetsp:Transcript_146393/g.207605  ORF Transcript_146393/g.207605 Transcript_146393/m.207605 type:complete len:91 (-) Transcript_146393:113-385(-)